MLLPGSASQATERNQDLIKLLDQGQCVGCQLVDADLVLANLNHADLRGAQLQRANLSQAQLDGAKLNGANLQGTSLLGASLRGADLRGANLLGTDLRQADLSGTLLDRAALENAHWQQAKGVNSNQLSYAQLHNAGVAAHEAGEPLKAELWFSQAIQRQPEAAVSWVARGISREQLGKEKLAASDFETASRLYGQRGDGESAQQLKQAAIALSAHPKKEPTSNGLGSQLLSTAASLMVLLGPLAGLALSPIGI